MSRENLINGVTGCKSCIRKFGLYLQARLTFAQSTLNSTREQFKVISNFYNASGTSLRLPELQNEERDKRLFFMYIFLYHTGVNMTFGVPGDQKQFKVKKKKSI